MGLKSRVNRIRAQQQFERELAEAKEKLAQKGLDEKTIDRHVKVRHLTAKLKKTGKRLGAADKLIERAGQDKKVVAKAGGDTKKGKAPAGKKGGGKKAAAAGKKAAAPKAAAPAKKAAAKADAPAAKKAAAPKAAVAAKKAAAAKVEKAE